MNIELNTPRNLSLRETYVNELTSTPYWIKPRLMEEVSGWTPGPNLRKRLLLEQIGELTRDIAQNRVRIQEWKSQLLKTKIQEEQFKLTKMIARWSKYNNSLMCLKEDVKDKLQLERVQ